MTSRDLVEAAVKTLPFELTVKQNLLLNALAAFTLSHGPKDIFILNGYAGTGKTSVIGALVKGLKEMKLKTVVLAPTGRAAKVAANLSASGASTIHKRLFRGNSLDPSNHHFFLAENKESDTLFIVDEASLITDASQFSSSLLQQLIYHVYSGKNCCMILVGDIAQLPPVGMKESPAMNPDRISQLGFNPIEFTLDKPLRQASHSGILFNATFIRKALFSDRPLSNFGIIKRKFRDIKVVEMQDLGEAIVNSWNKVSPEETLIITRSNIRANQYNDAIRKEVMYAEHTLERGDRLIIAKNDYYWSRINKLPTFLANGESAVVTWIGKKEKAYGRWFVDVELKLNDYEDPIGAKILMRSLVSEGPSVPKEEMDAFYNKVLIEYPGEISEKIKGVTEDPFYNALQVKYAYCVTCHKAQGGQWKHVYIDLAGLKIEPGDEKDFYKWLYTAVSRATEKVFFINPSFKIVE